MPYMNMRFPTVMTLPWRADAAEFWFARLSHLPFAMLLHSGHADHPYSRFDILVADPVKTLTTDALSPTDDPLMRLQNEIDALGLTATPDPDLPFQGRAGPVWLRSGSPFRKAARACAGGYFPAGYGGGAV